MEVFSNFQYKRRFLSHIRAGILANKSEIQLYRIEDYLKGIHMPVIPYRTTFNFMVFVTKGWIKQYADGIVYTTEKNEIIFIKPRVITATMELSDDVEGFFLVYESSIFSMQALFKYKTNVFFMTSFFRLDDSTYSNMIQLLTILERELTINELNINDITITMLHVILEKLLSLDALVPYKITTRSMELSLRFRNLLLKHHVTEKRVGFYADKLFVTHQYLNKCVQNVVQKSPKQWINEIDINYAKALLHSTKTITDIAYELNYQSIPHFTQLFKKITGLTPQLYRRQLLKEQFKLLEG